MIPLLRLLSFCLGCALTIAPSMVFLAFAYGVGDSAEPLLLFLSVPLVIGLLLGGGPLLIGLPKLVAGPEKPTMRLVAGVLLAISIAGFLVMGFDGSVTRIVSPIVLLIETLLFAVFVWPAKNFFANPAFKRDAEKRGAP